MKDLKTISIGLNADNEKTRLNAVKELAMTKVPQAAPFLKKALSDSSERVKLLAQKALAGFKAIGLLDDDNDSPLDSTVTMIVNKSVEQGNHNSIIGKISHLFKSTDPEQQKKAVFACARLANKQASIMLVNALDNITNSAVKTMIIRTLATFADINILSHKVFPVLNTDQNVQNKIKLITSLSARTDVNTAPQILPFLLSNDPSLRDAAARGLKQVGRASSIQGLLSMSTSNIENNKIDCAKILSSFQIREASIILEKLLDDSSKNVKKIAIDSLRKLATNSNASAIQILSKKNISIESSIIKKIPNQILKDLTSDKIDIKRKSIKKIVALGGKTALNTLTARLTEEIDKEILPNLIRAIGDLGDKEVIPYLSEYVFNPDPWLRAEALNALMCADSIQAMPLAALCLKDPVPEVKIAACKAVHNYPHIDIELFIKELLYSSKTPEQEAGVRLISELKEPAYFNLFIHDTIKKSPNITKLCIKALEEAQEYFPDALEIRNRLKVISNKTTSKSTVDLDDNLFKDFSMDTDDSNFFEGISIDNKAFENDPIITSNHDNNISKSANNSASNSSGNSVSNSIDNSIDNSVSKKEKMSSIPLMIMGLDESDNDIKNSIINDLSNTLNIEFKKFFSCKEDEQKKYIFNIRNDITEKNYNFILCLLRYSNTSDIIKRLCEKAVKSFENRLDLNDYAIDSNLDIDSIEKSVTMLSTKNQKIDFDIKSVSYAGGKSFSILKTELREREKMFQVRNYWEGAFPRSKVLLNSLRLDTQEMILKTLSDNEKPDLAFLILYNEQLEPFAEALKTPDSPNSIESLDDIFDETALSNPLYESLAKKTENPRYVIFITSASKIIIFLRAGLEEKLSYFTEIPFNEITKINSLSENKTGSLIITLNSRFIQISGFRKNDLEKTISKLKSKIK